MKVVLRFLAGLNKLNSFSIEEIGSNLFQTPSPHGLNTLNSFSREEVAENLLPHECNRYLISCNAAVGVDLVRCFFEAQNNSVVEHVLGQKTIEFRPSSEMKPLDCYSLGYCISHSQCQWVLELGGNIDEDGVTMLVNATRTRKKPRGKIVGLSGLGLLSKNYSIH